MSLFSIKIWINSTAKIVKRVSHGYERDSLKSYNWCQFWNLIRKHEFARYKLELSRLLKSTLISFDFQLFQIFAICRAAFSSCIEDIHRKFEKRKLCPSTFGPNAEKSSFIEHFPFITSSVEWYTICPRTNSGPELKVREHFSFQYRTLLDSFGFLIWKKNVQFWKRPDMASIVALSMYRSLLSLEGWEGFLKSHQKAVFYIALAKSGWIKCSLSQ